MKGPKKEKSYKNQPPSKSNTGGQKPIDNTTKNIQDNLQQGKRTLENYALNVLKMKESESNKYIKGFRLIDRDNSGLVTKLEFRKLLDKYNFGINWTHEIMDGMFDSIDENKSGKINGEEFLSYLNDENRNRKLAVMVDILVHSEKAVTNIEENKEVIDQKAEKRKREKEEIARKQDLYKKLGPEEYAKTYLNIDTKLYQKYLKTFDLMDLNDNEDISRFEFKSLLKQFSLGMNLTKDEAKEMFFNIDKDQDGEVNLQDFLESLNRNNPNKQLLGIIEEVISHKKEIKAYKQKNIFVKSKQLIKNKEKPQIKGFDEKTLEKYNDIFYVLASEIKGSFNLIQYKAALKLHAQQFGFIQKSPEKISKSFGLMDTDKDGNVNFADFVQNIQKGDNKLLNDLVANLLKLETDIKDSKDSENIEKAVKYAQSVLKLSPKIIEKCKKAFNLIDADGSGELSLEELNEIISVFNLMPEESLDEAKKIFEDLDQDKSGKIGLKEFFEGISDFKKNEKLEKLVENIFEREQEIFDHKLKQTYWKTATQNPTQNQFIKETEQEIMKGDRNEREEKVKKSAFLPSFFLHLEFM